MVADHLAELLAGVRGGEPEALEKFTAAVYPALTGIARSLMLAERNGHTLTTRDLTQTLVEQLLISPARPDFDSPRSFFYAAVRGMRQILVQYARARNSVKRGGGRVRVDLTPNAAAIDCRLDEIVAVHQALDRLDTESVTLVELHYFAGFTLEEAAEIAGISGRTASRRLAGARAALWRDIGSGPPSV